MLEHFHTTGSEAIRVQAECSFEHGSVHGAKKWLQCILWERALIIGVVEKRILSTASATEGELAPVARREQSPDTKGRRVMKMVVPCNMREAEEQIRHRAERRGLSRLVRSINQMQRRVPPKRKNLVGQGSISDDVERIEPHSQTHLSAGEQQLLRLLEQCLGTHFQRGFICSGSAWQLYCDRGYQGLRLEQEFLPVV